MDEEVGDVRLGSRIKLFEESQRRAMGLATEVLPRRRPLSLHRRHPSIHRTVVGPPRNQAEALGVIHTSVNSASVAIRHALDFPLVAMISCPIIQTRQPSSRSRYHNCICRHHTPQHIDHLIIVTHHTHNRHRHSHHSPEHGAGHQYCVKEVLSIKSPTPTSPPPSFPCPSQPCPIPAWILIPTSGSQLPRSQSRLNDHL